MRTLNDLRSFVRVQDETFLLGIVTVSSYKGMYCLHMARVCLVLTLKYRPSIKISVKSF